MTVRQVIVVGVDTDGSGDAEVYSGEGAFGEILRVDYIKDDFADGSTFTITAEKSGEPIWSETGVNASASRAPRRPVHATDGTAALYAGGGTAVLGPIYVGGERIKIVIADGGNAKSGQFRFLIG